MEAYTVALTNERCPGKDQPSMHIAPFGALSSFGSPEQHFFCLFALISLFRNQLIGNIVFIDVAHVLDGLSTNTLRGQYLYMPEPHVRIESALRRLLA